MFLAAIIEKERPSHTEKSCRSRKRTRALLDDPNVESAYAQHNRHGE